MKFSALQSFERHKYTEFHLIYYWIEISKSLMDELGHSDRHINFDALSSDISKFIPALLLTEQRKDREHDDNIPVVLP